MRNCELLRRSERWGCRWGVDFHRFQQRSSCTSCVCICIHCQQKTPMPARRVLFPGKQQLTKENKKWILVGIEVIKENEDAITSNPAITPWLDCPTRRDVIRWSRLRPNGVHDAMVQGILDKEQHQPRLCSSKIQPSLSYHSAQIREMVDASPATPHLSEEKDQIFKRRKGTNRDRITQWWKPLHKQFWACCSAQLHFLFLFFSHSLPPKIP